MRRALCGGGGEVHHRLRPAGLVAEHGSSWLLPRLIGTSRALDLLLSGRLFTSEEAHELGVVNRVVAVENVLADAVDYARDLAANCSPASLAAIKDQVYRHFTVGLGTAKRESDRLMGISLTGPDFTEGVGQFCREATAPLPTPG